MEMLQVALTTLLAALVGTFGGGFITYKATTKVEEKKQVHEARLAEVQRWSDLRDLAVETLDRISKNTIERSRHAVNSDPSGREIKETGGLYFTQEATYASAFLHFRLETAAYIMYDNRSEQHLRLILNNFHKGIKDSEQKGANSEKWDSVNIVFAELLEGLLKGQEFSREMLKKGQSALLPPAPTGGMYT